MRIFAKTKNDQIMTHDDEMWQDYDYHRNTGELPEYFDDDIEEEGSPFDDRFEWPRRVEDGDCPECHCSTGYLHKDGSLSCAFCGTRYAFEGSPKYECPECHCTTLYPHNDGSVSCAFCGTRFFIDVYGDDSEE